MSDLPLPPTSRRLKKEIESNKELQQTLKDLKGDQTLNKAAQAAREAAQKVQGAASQAADTASDAATKASSAAAKAAEEASKAGRGFVGKDGAAADEAQHKTTAGASSEDGKEKKASADDTPLPLFERLSRDVASLLSSFSETANSAASSAANAAKPSGPADTDTTSVVVRPPSFWEKNFNQVAEAPQRLPMPTQVPSFSCRWLTIAPGLSILLRLPPFLRRSGRGA